MVENGSANESPDPVAGSTLDVGGETKWKRIWKLACPGKIKHFLWRCAHNTLATKDILARRGVKIEDHKCFLCNSRPESGRHLFVECKEVKLVWREMRLEHVRARLASCESIEQTMDVLWQLTEE